MKPTPTKSTFIVASAILLALVFCTATLPQPAFGWFALPPPPSRLVLPTGASPAGTSVPVLRLPLPHLGQAMAFGAPVVRPVYPQRRNPFDDMRRWVECVNAHNGARLRGAFFGIGSRPAPTPLVSNSLGPCGPPPNHVPAPIIVERPVIMLPHISVGPPRLLPVPNGGERR